MKSWLQRRRRLFEIARERHAADPGELAGEQGEQDVLDLATKLAGGFSRNAYIYPALRVPKTEELGKFEIDLVVAGRYGIVCLEIKAWKGEVEALSPATWQQINGRGERLRHANPFALLKKKTDALQAYLADNGVALGPDWFHPVVVWTEALKVSADIQATGQTLPIGELAAFLRAEALQAAPSRVRHWLARVGFAERKPRLDLPAVSAIMDRLPTWDVVYYHGGRIARGDFQGEAIRLSGGTVLNRRNTKALELTVPRRFLTALATTPKVTWIDRDGKIRTAAIDLPQTQRLMLAGQNKILEVNLAEVEAVVFGWQDDSYYHPRKL